MRKLTEKDRIEFAQRLKSVISSRGLDLEQIARATKENAHNVYRYKEGFRYPNIMFVIAFCQEYGINMEWLLSGDVTIKHEAASNSIDYMRLDQRDELMHFIVCHKPDVIKYIRDETGYKEPPAIKEYRHAHGLSRKVMYRLLIQASTRV